MPFFLTLAGCTGRIGFSSLHFRLPFRSGMTGKYKTVTIEIDAESDLRLRSAAVRKGISVEQYCSEAVFKELNNDSSAQKISLKGSVTTGKVILRGNLSIRDTADDLLALRDEISREITSSADSVGLIREARRRRGQRQEELGRC